MTRLSLRQVAIVLGMLGSVPALATPPPAMFPRATTGFSTVEQRYTYAPPDEGTIEFQMRPSGAAAEEIAIEEPEMCEGSAHAKIDYSKADNEVRVQIWYDGLPYRMDAAFEEDRSTPWNQFPQAVTDGKWQVWLVGRILSFDTLFWYDALTGELIGNEFDVDYESLPPSAFPIPLPTMQMVCITHLFESDPNTLKAKVDVTLDYDHITDVIGTGGVYFTYVPKQLCQPDALTIYYTNGGLPPDVAMTWDDVLYSINSGYNMALATSLEPDPKPEYIRARDNIMIGWAGQYPVQFPLDYESNPLTGELKLRETCATRERPRLANPYYDFCGPVQ